MLMLTVKLFIANSKTNYTGDSLRLYLSFNHIKASHFLFSDWKDRTQKKYINYINNRSFNYCFYTAVYTSLLLIGC